MGKLSSTFRGLSLSLLINLHPDIDGTETTTGLKSSRSDSPGSMAHGQAAARPLPCCRCLSSSGERTARQCGFERLRQEPGDPAAAEVSQSALKPKEFIYSLTSIRAWTSSCSLRQLVSASSQQGTCTERKKERNLHSTVRERGVGNLHKVALLSFRSLVGVVVDDHNPDRRVCKVNMREILSLQIRPMHSLEPTPERLASVPMLGVWPRC